MKVGGSERWGFRVVLWRTGNNNNDIVMEVIFPDVQLLMPDFPGWSYAHNIPPN